MKRLASESFTTDEIESIKFFDINTQRSIIKTKEVEIYPLYEMFYDNEKLEKIIYNIKESMNNNSFDKKSVERIENDINDLENHNNIDRLSRYMSKMDLKLETISDYIGNKNIVYWNHKNIMENYDDVIRDLSDWYESTSDYPKLGFDLVKDINHIFSEKSLYLDVFGDSKKYKIETNIRSKEAVMYNNNIHMCINDLNKYEKFTTVVIAFKSKEKLSNFISEKIPLKEIVFEHYLNFIPYYGNLFSPLFTFISVILFTSKMAYKTEFVAILSSGTSFKRILRPYMIGAALITGMSLILNHFIIPKSNKVRINFEDKYINESYNTEERNIHKQIAPGTTLYMADYDNFSNSANQISIEKYSGLKLKLVRTSWIINGA